MDPDKFLEEFDESQKIAQQSGESIKEQYHKFANFVSSNNCKVKGGKKW